VDKAGFTPLLAAAGNGDTNAPLVKLLLEHGAAVNVTSGDTVETVKNGPLALGHMTPLQLAAQIAPFETVQALVNAGADVNAKDIRGATALVWAVATDRTDPKVVQLLLAKGADPQLALDWVRRNQNPAILPLFGLKPAPLSAVSGPAPRRSPGEAVMKALAVSQPVAGKFIATGGCVSCHAQYLNGLAVVSAKAASLKPDTALEEADTHATVSLRGAMQESFFQTQDPPDGVEGVGFSFLQMAAEKAPPSLQIDSMIHHLAAMQRKEGDWPFFEGRPPIEGSAFSQTARAIRALRAYPIPGRQAEFDERIARAAAWLENNQPRTTEDRAHQILGLVWAGRTLPANRLQELVSRQRPDGGWAQTDQLGADAWATGEVLWALHESGMAPSHPVYKRGVDYLLRTQQDDGTWHVATRSFGFQPYFQSGFPYDHDQWISEAGTAMATIALTYAVN
jgi:N-acyl-D-amino-acid deacylase